MGKSNILRSAEMNQRYLEHRRQNPNEEPFFDWKERLVREFNNWRLIENRFPFDLIAEKHHLLIPKRKFGDGSEMNEIEQAELREIKEELASEYDFIMENFPRHRSIPGYFHLHLVATKDGNTQLSGPNSML